MLKKDVKVGEIYVTNQNNRVQILAETEHKSSKGATLTRWTAINLGTNRKVTIKSAAKLKRGVSA